MPGLNDVSFVKGQGGLGRSLPGQDYISGMIFYCANGVLPAGYSTSARIKHMLQISDAVNLGINNTFSDETQAAGTYTLTAVGATGDTMELKVQEPSSLVSFGKYAQLSTDTTITLLAASYAAFINSGTLTHGYTAVATVGAIAITARKGLGIFLNTGTPLTATIVGTIAGSITTTFTGGVASLLNIYYYHISEFFRINPQGNLWVGFFAVPGTFNGAEIQTMQDDLNVLGTLRQIGVYYTAAAWSTAQVTALQNYATVNETNNKPCSIIYSPDISGTTAGALTNLSGLASKNVSVTIGQDGAANGYAIFKATGKTIGQLGAVLGSVSLAAVNESIAWVAQHNITDGVENNVPAFGTGETWAGLSSSGTPLQLNNYRYIHSRNFIGQIGTYFNDSHCAVIQSSDYSKIENNRTIDKVIRLLRVAYLPDLNSPLLLNRDGTLTNSQVAYFQSKGDTALADMVRNSELSAQKTSVDPAQNVQSTGKLVIREQILATPAANFIQVNIGYVLAIK